MELGILEVGSQGPRLMEQQQRQKVVKALTKAGLDATSVENPAYPGTPDVQFIGGWMELKYLEDWPAKADTTVRIPHFSQQQRVWLLRRWVACQKLNTNDYQAWLLIYVVSTKDWLLFDGKTAATQVAKDGATKAKLFELAILTTKDLKDVIIYVNIR